MKIDWTPSEKQLAKIRHIHELKKTKTFDEVAEEVNLNRRYVIALHKWFKEAHREA